MKTITDERGKIGLFDDVLAVDWADMALNEGMDAIMVCDYLNFVIQNTTLAVKEKYHGYAANH